MSDKIVIFDTTLRDGEQAPGASLNHKEKLEIGHELADMGVDIIEAGFPISSPGDFESVKEIAKSIKGPTICGLARAIKADIDAAYEATKYSKNPRIHVFLATSKIHMQYKLKKAEDEILRLAVEWTKYAKKLCHDIEFSPEDASRTERLFLFKVVEAVIDAGATTVNIPDTVGYAYPEEYGALIRSIKENVPNIDKAVISLHCHNDLGLAVANSLAGVKNGARQVECTINGIGERAGNCSMEEVVMGIKTRKELFNVDTSIKTNHIWKVSRLVSKLTGFAVAPNKAIVGGNAFRHESGIHQDGVLKEPTTYEIIKPEDVGFTGTGIVLGKHSGRHALAQRLAELGYANLSQPQIDQVNVRFKELADKKKNVFDDDLIALVEDETKTIKPVWVLESFEINSGTKVTPVAEVNLRYKGKKVKGKSSGDGPIDACFKAVDKATGVKAELQDFRIEAVTKGKDALGEVSLKLKAKGKVVTSHASSTDIIESSVRAYIAALNKIESI